ncbi:MAG TPA: signal peptidase I [Candidatus Limnocylindrales bacterium]|jgi:signal peptidase
MKALAGATIWLRRIVDLALIALILVVLFGVILGKLVPLTGRSTIAVGGRSMEPALQLGSAIVVEPVSPDALNVGDVVSMRIQEANAIFTHRVQLVVDRPDGRWVQTKGDANAEPDPTLVPASAIIGRVLVSVPLMGYVLALLSMPIGVIFVVGLAATLLAVAWLLESLEPVPAGPGRAAVPAREPAPRAGSAGSGTPPSAAPALLPVSGAMALQLVAPGTRTPLLPDPAASPRPNAREQIARSQAIRRQRARWTIRHRPRGIR